MEILGMILNITAMAILVVSFQLKSRKAIILWQCVADFVFTAGFAVVEAYMGAFTNFAFAIRNIVFLILDEKGVKYRNGITLGILCAVHFAIYCAFMLVLDTTVKDKIFSVLPLVSAVVGTLAYFREDVDEIRLYKIGESVSWLTYDIYIGVSAIGSVVGEVFNLISIAVAVARSRKSKRNGKENTNEIQS